MYICLGVASLGFLISLPLIYQEYSLIKQITSIKTRDFRGLDIHVHCTLPMMFNYVDENCFYLKFGQK